MILIVTRACDGCAARVAALRADGVEVDVLALPGMVWTTTACARCCPSPPSDEMSKTETMADAERGAAYRHPQGLRRPIRGRRPPRPTPVPPTPTGAAPVPSFLRRMVVKGGTNGSSA